jgi:IS30 family transposase
VGIHLVSSSPAPCPNERRLSLGNYTADIVISTREENCCYYVIQRVRSAEIIEMARVDNREDAEAAAKAALERWNDRDLLQRI